MRDVINIVVGLLVVAAVAACAPGDEAPRHSRSGDVLSTTQKVHAFEVYIDCIEEVGYYVDILYRGALTGFESGGGTLSERDRRNLYESIIRAYASRCALNKLGVDV